MIDKAYRKSQIVYFISITILILGFIFDYLYTTKYIVPIENVGLERWAIILTLGAIYAALRLLHPKLDEKDKEDSIKALKKYMKKYYARHILLSLLCISNMVCFYYTGAKNFSFLSIIVIFAMFLCMPNKKQIKEETNNLD